MNLKSLQHKKGKGLRYGTQVKIAQAVATFMPNKQHCNSSTSWLDNNVEQTLPLFIIVSTTLFSIDEATTVVHALLE